MSCVPGGSWAAGLVGCLCGRGVAACALLVGGAAIGVLWVRVYSSPPFFVAAGVHLWTAGNRKVAACGECLVSSFA